MANEYELSREAEKIRNRLAVKKSRLRPEYKAKQKEYLKKYRLRPENKARKNELSKLYRSNPKNKEKIYANIRKSIIDVKNKVFSHYSKSVSNSDIPICACCGYSDFRFLALDHIYGRKNVSEKEKKLASIQLWTYIMKLGFPKGYQILCYNCNFAKGKGRYCPHQLDKMKN